MKSILVGIALLFTLSLAVASQESAALVNNLGQATVQLSSITPETAEVTSPPQSTQRSHVMSRAEAEILHAQEAQLLAKSEIGDIKVGSVGSNDLIYILVVVLLVVVIIQVL